MSIDTKNFIQIKGANHHNLKDFDIDLPKNKFIVFTGVSGSGKSSLAFDTLYAEGQRRYIESLSSYARQFLGKLEKPKVENIKGLSPAIAIDQKVQSSNARSTVGTVTEIYEYLKLLFAKVGKLYSPETGEEIKKYPPSAVLQFIKDSGAKDGDELFVLVEISQDTDLLRLKDFREASSYSRIINDGKVLKIKDALEQNISENYYLIVDRLFFSETDDFSLRMSNSVQNAYAEGDGKCVIKTKEDEYFTFTNYYPTTENTLEPSVQLFNFNSPYGACPTCQGYGQVIGIDEDLVFKKRTLSVYEDGIFCWRGEKMSAWKDELIRHAHKFDFPIHKPILELSKEQYKLLWTGNKHFKGLNDFFKMLESESYKIQYRVMLSKYRGKTICPDCEGKRLRKEAFNIKIDGYHIGDFVDIPLSELQTLIESLNFSETEKEIVKIILAELSSRLSYLNEVGLGYLTVNRQSGTLSGGEYQRIRLTTSLGSSLVGAMYILDEPSIGLHPRDTNKLIEILQNLRDLGNTIIVVEHDQEVMESADFILDLGPEAGINGGEVMYAGNLKNIFKSESLTTQYLTNKLQIQRKKTIKKIDKFIKFEGAYANNLKNVDVSIPLNGLSVITGVSGSGKSTLLNEVVYKMLQNHFEETNHLIKFKKMSGDWKFIDGVKYIDQNPIGKSSRSNPATYTKVFDDIRTLFANTKIAKLKKLKPGYFSFNSPGGRCEVCKGERKIKVEMQFMPDIHLTCEECGGKRYQKEALEIKIEGKNIYDVLNFTVDEALEFFENLGSKNIVKKLKPLKNVGLGYVKLGQSSNTLSGGEAQRVKLASFLALEDSNPMLFIFDEPTTGLHFHDIQKLLDSFNLLLEKGHSIVVIEHNLDVISASDWVIDLGPDGGKNGGNILYQGKVNKDFLNHKESLTAKYLNEHLQKKEN